MNDSIYETYESLSELAESLPFSKERSLLREKAMNIADALQDERKQFDARLAYVNDICMEGSFPEKYLTIFPWLLSYVLKNKNEDDILYVMWYYKWVIMIMHEYPSISKVQIENALLDLKKRYNECGSTDKVYHDYSRESFLYMGDYERSTYHHEKHSKLRRRDQLDDCEACVLNRAVTYYIFTNKIDKALKHARPILNGSSKCTHVPKDTYANFIVPLILHDQTELAASMAEKLEKELKRNKYGGNYKNCYPLIFNFTIHQQYTKAVKLFEKYIPNAYEQQSADGRFHLYVSALYLFSAIEKKKIKLLLPKRFPLYNEENTYEISSLIHWFDEETTRIALLFDIRNGNKKYTDWKKSIMSYDK